MSRIRSELRALLAALPFAVLVAAPLHAQDAPVAPVAPPVPPTARIVSHEVSLSRDAATLRLELADGRTVDMAVEDGRALLNGSALGTATRGGELDRSWRELLTHVMDSGTEALPSMLAGWEGDGSSAGAAMDRALEQAVGGDGSSLVAPVAPVPLMDSLSRLEAELERERQAMEMLRAEMEERSENRWRPGPFHYIASGFGNVMSVLIIFAVLMALAIGTIFFGGRRYIEAVADTARHNTSRSLLVGIAGTFLIMPVFVLGIIALAISIVGILAIPIWVIGFPIALFGALVLGYLAIAHAGGEALAERRFYVNDWFQRGNSYYFILTGLGLLLALFVAAAVVSMAGPWLRVISNLLTFFAIVTTWAAFTIGFGAVLVSRGGTRPRGVAPAPEPDLFSEEAGIP